MIGEFADDIRERIRCEVRENEPMAGHTSFGIGGPADIWAKPETRDDLVSLLDLCGARGVPHMIIGKGTNLLVRDGGIDGVVINLDSACGNLASSEAVVTAGAAASLNALARFAAKQGLRGLAFCIGIPGSVGGGLVSNAGAWGSELGSSLRSALIYDSGSRQSRAVEHDEIDFGYRKSDLATFGVILEAEFELEREDPDAIEDLMKQYLAQRSESQPSGFRSAGCVFKNPPGGYAGALIDALGFKGHLRGGAMVSDVHANFILNTGTATAGDVLALMSAVKERARVSAGIELEEEIGIVGRD